MSERVEFRLIINSLHIHWIRPVLNHLCFKLKTLQLDALFLGQELRVSLAWHGPRIAVICCIQCLMKPNDLTGEPFRFLFQHDVVLVEPMVQLFR